MRCVSRAGACGCLMLLAGSVVAAPQQSDEPVLRRVLVTAGLQQRTVNVVSISEQELTARDAASGATVRVPLSNVRALLPVMVPLGGIGNAGSRRGDAVGRRLTSDEPAVLVTTDGQQLPGRPELGTRVTSTDQLPWVSDVLGTVLIPLEDVQRLLGRASTPVRSAGTADRVYLRNADVIEGFVELVPEAPGQSITLSVDTGGDRAARIEWTAVDSVEFAASPQAARGPWVWLSNGSSLAASAVSVSPQGQMVIGWPRVAAEPSLPAASLWAFVPAREHIDALAARPLVGVSPEGDRKYAQQPRAAEAPAPLGAQDIEVSGPVTAVWDLGTGALRISGVVEMAPSDRVWGDCTVTLEDVASGSDGALTAEGRELWTARINGDSPSAAFLVDLPAADDPRTPRRLRVRVGEGANGPVQDRVWLRRVLIER